MLTIAPFPFSTIPLEKTCVTRKVDMKLRSKTWRNPAGSRLKNDWVDGPDDSRGARTSSEGLARGWWRRRPALRLSKTQTLHAPLYAQRTQVFSHGATQLAPTACNSGHISG